ncbi:MAG: DUF2064 domain-containing protein [Marinirhabdus sp.]|nr:DUF2064 domain-containing protein [Marinirhabdus sp.]
MLFEALNEQTLKKVQQTKLPYFIFSEKEQIGGSFGERYVNAIQNIFDKGYDNVITIGNDTPNLQTKQLLDAAKSVSQQQVVFGPSIDGGYYLMGLHRSQFNPEAFLQLPWQTQNLLGSFKRLLAVKNTKVVLLQTLRDIDTVADIKKLMDGFKLVCASLLRIFHTIFEPEAPQYPAFQFATASFQKQQPFNKGSPRVLHS